MQHLRAALDTVVEAAKILASLTAVLTALAFAVPWVEVQIQLLTAARFGASGYVYYGLDTKKGLPTTAGSLALLKPGSGLFSEITVGDKLQASSSKHFRDEATTKSRARFALQQGDCVIVLSIDNEAQTEEGISGGWLRVATVACGLFR